MSYLIILFYTLTVISIHITGNGLSGATPIAGQRYTLTCSVDVHGNQRTPTISWEKNGSILHNEIARTLSFSSLRLFDAGKYNCNAIIDNTEFTDSENIILKSKLGHCLSDKILLSAMHS